MWKLQFGFRLTSFTFTAEVRVLEQICWCCVVQRFDVKDLLHFILTFLDFILWKKANKTGTCVSWLYFILYLSWSRCVLLNIDLSATYKHKWNNLNWVKTVCRHGGPPPDRAWRSRNEAGLHTPKHSDCKGGAGLCYMCLVFRCLTEMLVSVSLPTSAALK